MNALLSPASLTPGLGTRIRTRRRVINHTLEQIATAAGVSTSFLSQVERDLATPSVRSLAKIAHALNLPMQYFVDTADASVSRSQLRQFFGLAGSGCSFAHLTAALPHGQLQSILVRMPAGSQQPAVTTDALEESLFVTAGEFTLSLENETLVLHAGDAAYYRSNQVHHWANRGTVETTVVWTGTPRLL
ncbi:XRE family transcriptional regulator [Paraburkholderia sediminicola]|uniref:helix-turn-helix domain-containing protein n=1 Tax=Paraburkholderia sediminicola TaxID=458836 RepID=UPI0038B787B1